MTSPVLQFAVQEDGQDLVEYALLAGLLSVVCIIVLNAVGGSISVLFADLSAALRAA